MSHRSLLLAIVSLTNALPVQYRPGNLVVNLVQGQDSLGNEKLTSSEFYIYLIASTVLVLMGGVFAGLTLGLMGQDEIYLKVIAASGTPNERKCASKVLELLGHGKHWLLVTLLLSNVITNETLPVILDRFLGGGFIAVFSSTVAIVIFGEIIPQSVCVRYGLQLGAFFAPYVLGLMYILYPIAYPIALLLDWSLGQDHGTLYKKSGLKTLVNLHHTMGTERLNTDEVTIINAVLDLKTKPVKEILTPIEKVFTLPADHILDEEAIEEIFNAGYSRIPIHLPGEKTNFVGMLLVRILISYDPEDELPVSSFPLATLPETASDTSCLNILNYFQEGKSHMVLVSDTPGGDTGGIGVVTLEDVIEELIGEEIVDESDVYIDENKTIMRSIPGPFSKRNVSTYLNKLYHKDKSPSESSHNIDGKVKNAYIYKSSFENRNSTDSKSLQVSKGIKPSNLASNPLQTANPRILIKKQPALPSTVIQANKHQDNENENEECVESTPFDLSSNGYGTPNNEETLEVYPTEVSAYVSALVDNSIRSEGTSNITTSSRMNLEDKKKAFRNVTYGIPIPTNNNDNGIVENEIISSSGVNKIIIETNEDWE
ncbi:Mam3 protein [Martiniozyma asiatica (nom. inval.)]|nr:Mam3 protein [Martiniozyma asiatica]